MSDISKTCSRANNRTAAAVVMRAKLADLDGYWLEFNCRCGRTVFVAGRVGRNRRLGRHRRSRDLRKCGAKPVQAWLNETQSRVAGLVPCPAGPSS